MNSIWIAFVLITLCSMCSGASIDSSIKIPNECHNRLFCDVEPANYPREHFDNFVLYLKNKNLMKSPQYEGEPAETIHYDEDNCSTRTTIIRPFIVRSNSTSRLVVQTKYFEQRVKQTECLSQEESCFKKLVRLEFAATCSPTFGTMKLYLFNTASQQFEYEDVTFPVCCSCGFKSII